MGYLKKSPLKKKYPISFLLEDNQKRRRGPLFFFLTFFPFFLDISCKNKSKVEPSSLEVPTKEKRDTSSLPAENHESLSFSRKNSLSVGALGYIEPRSRSIKMSFATENTFIQDVKVQPGQKVKKGDILAYNGEFLGQKAKLIVTKERIKLAEHDYASRDQECIHAKKELSRYLIARKAQAGTAEKEDRLKHDVEMAEKEREKALLLLNLRKEEEAAAKIQLERCTLKAPFDGTVLNIQGRPGEKACSKGVLTLANLDVFEVVAEVSEHDIDHIHLEQKAEIRLSNADQDFFEGKVIFKGFEVSRNSMINLDPKNPQDLRIIEVRIALHKKYAPRLKHSIYRQVSIRFLNPPLKPGQKKP